MFPVDARLEHAVHRFQEIVAMGLDMETNQVCSQQAFQQFTPPGTDAEGFRIRPGNMPEDGYTRVRPVQFNQPRQQSEVIILNQYNWPRRIGDLFQYCFSKFSVHFEIALPIGRAKNRTSMGNMTERP